MLFAGGITYISPDRPLVVEAEGEDEAYAVPECKLVVEMDNAGMVKTRLVRDRVPLDVRMRQEQGESKFWYVFWGIILCVLGAISYRSYKVTVVFDYNVRKLHTFYRHLNKTINPIGEARVVVYEYQDREHLLWEKLEKKYGETVLEPDECVFPDEPEVVEEEDGNGEGGAEEGSEGGNKKDDEL